MADPYDDWSPDAHLEQMYEDRFYVPDDPYEEDPDEDGSTGCANCGHGVGETDDDGLCARCGPVPWPEDATT